MTYRPCQIIIVMSDLVFTSDGGSRKKQRSTEYRYVMKNPIRSLSVEKNAEKAFFFRFIRTVLFLIFSWIDYGLKWLISDKSSYDSTMPSTNPPSAAFATKESEQIEDEWDHFEDTDDFVGEALSASQSEATPTTTMDFANLPPQLQPAVSLGVKRVSSCYFSLGSEQGSIEDLLSHFNDESDAAGISTEKNKGKNTRKTIRLTQEMARDADILYHDILMNVFTFLGAPSLAAFSETAKRPNYEVFYFLQLQLQRSLLAGCEKPNESRFIHDDKSLSSIAGCNCVSRLARMDMGEAQAVVDAYLCSNSTLRTMPLSHSLAYFRHALMQRNGFFQDSKMYGDRSTSAQALASAALLVTVVGAAIMTGSAQDAASMAESFGGELPNMLFGVGFMGSALMASRKMGEHSIGDGGRSQKQKNEIDHAPQTMKERAEHMARTLQEFPLALRQEFPEKFCVPSLVELRHTIQATLVWNDPVRSSKSVLVLSNPYDHLVDDEKKESEGVYNTKVPDPKVAPKVPSGSVGAYSRAIHEAAKAVRIKIREDRSARFYELSSDDQKHLSLAFLDACSSDSTISIVEELIVSIDVDGFFVGPDGSETCALHTAAFHGAWKVLDFLCQDIDYGDGAKSMTYRYKDGGLCDINIRDSNGWTALHFAAGANSTEAAEILATHGAVLSAVASNGYTPLQWAQRLSNEEVAEKIKLLLFERGDPYRRWIPSHPLSKIANHFFAMIPSQG